MPAALKAARDWCSLQRPPPSRCPMPLQFDTTPKQMISIVQRNSYSLFRFNISPIASTYRYHPNSLSRSSNESKVYKPPPHLNLLKHILHTPFLAVRISSMALMAITLQWLASSSAERTSNSHTTRSSHSPPRVPLLTVSLKRPIRLKSNFSSMPVIQTRFGSSSPVKKVST